MYVRLGVGVGVTVSVGVWVGLAVGVLVGLAVGVVLGGTVGLLVGVPVAAAVGVLVTVRVGVLVGVVARVAVDVRLGGGSVGVGVGVMVAVAADTTMMAPLLPVARISPFESDAPGILTSTTVSPLWADDRMSKVHFRTSPSGSTVLARLNVPIRRRLQTLGRVQLLSLVHTDVPSVHSVAGPARC